jgi:tetratricopeptide (TPR) repeat protein
MAALLRKLARAGAATVLGAFVTWAGALADSALEAEAVRDLIHDGEFAEAMETAKNLLSIDGDDGPILNALGEAQLAVGRLDAAKESFDRAYALDDAGRIEAMAHLGALARYRGDVETAERWFRRVVDEYNSGASLTSRELAAVAAASEGLGDGDPAFYHDAVRLYGEATLIDHQNVEARVALGNLLLDKYNNTEALDAFKEALAIEDDFAPAQLGLARSQYFDGSGDALTTLLTCLEQNPDYVPARAFLAQLLIESEQYELAWEEANRALETNPNSLRALAVLAGVNHFRGWKEQFDATVARIDAINPRYADLYNTLAELSVRNRLYFDAVAFAQRAVDMDPRSWQGYAILGVNQLRIGEMEAGRENVEKSFAGNPFNVWTKNTLDFLDSQEEYETIESDNVVVVLHRDEAKLLAPYVKALAEEAYAYYVKRYDWKPEGRIRVELYPDHRDFSVRTVGLSGIGILGVSFGPVVALDSPAARPRGSFNWGSVLWHEIAHTFHMGLSDYRVPRWFSEGLSVFEERHAREGWGNDVTVDFIKAYSRGMLLPVSELNNGFVRPTYPQQIGHSYYHASLVFDFIESRWGFAAIREMLVGYGDDLTTGIMMYSDLGLTKKEFDAAFDAYFRERFKSAIAALPRRSLGNVPLDQIWRVLADQIPGDYQVQMSAAAGAWNADEFDVAEKFLKRAHALFPEYAGDDSPYRYLSEIYAKRGDLESASDQLRRMIAINADSYDAHTALARMLKEIGDEAGAADALARAVYIYPYNPALHEELAALHESLGDWDMAVRARESVLALAPIDLADAHYRLAYAYGKAGDRPAARYQVLRALERAPSYPEALELLLELHGEGDAARRPSD